MNPADLEAAIARFRAGDGQALIDAIPYLRWMGISTTIDDAGVLGQMAFAEAHIGNFAIRALHGGTLGALLESTAILQTLYTGDGPTLPRIVNLTVEYLRSAQAKPTFARASFTKRGRRVASVRTWAWQDDEDKPVAAATAHLLLT